MNSSNSTQLCKIKQFNEISQYHYCNVVSVPGLPSCYLENLKFHPRTANKWHRNCFNYLMNIQSRSISRRAHTLTLAPPPRHTGWSDCLADNEVPPAPVDWEGEVQHQLSDELDCIVYLTGSRKYVRMSVCVCVCTRKGVLHWRKLFDN